MITKSFPGRCRAFCAASALAVAMLPAASFAAVVNNPFDIVVNFDGNMSATQESVFTGAELFWETMLLGNRYDVALPSLQINANAQFIDGPGGTLGSAGPNGFALVDAPASQDYVYATAGNMNFDTADLDELETAGTLFDVIVHEMAHVIGFGTMWTIAALNAGNPAVANVVDPYVDGSGAYTGAYGLTAYNAEFGLSGGFVPVELEGGPGTANGHWDEVDFAGGFRDIMTGFLNGVSPDADAPFAASTLSATTIASFADIGYLTVVTDPEYIMSAVPVPAAFGLGLMGLAGLGGLRLGRRRKA